MIEAVASAHRHGCNPGGQVLGIVFPPELAGRLVRDAEARGAAALGAARGFALSRMRGCGSWGAASIPVDSFRSEALSG